MEDSKVFFRLGDAPTEIMRVSFSTHGNNSSVFSYVAPFQIQNVTVLNKQQSHKM